MVKRRSMCPVLCGPPCCPELAQFLRGQNPGHFARMCPNMCPSVPRRGSPGLNCPRKRGDFAHPALRRCPRWG